MSFRCTILLILALALLAGCGQQDTGATATRIQQGTTTSADGVVIHYAVGGHGPAVVLIHCWGGNASFWGETAADLMRDHTVVVLDLAGHGRSGRERTDYTIEAFGADVVAVLEAAQVEPAVLVGHSMGGSVALEVARRVPGRVVGVVGVDNLHAPAWAFTDEQIDQFLAPMRADFGPAVTAFVTDMFPAGSDSAAIHRALDSMLAMPPEIAVSALDNLFHYDLPGAADALRVPLRLVNDDRYPVMVEAWREHGVDVAVTVLPQVGHFPMFTAPEKFRQALREAIVSLEG